MVRAFCSADTWRLVESDLYRVPVAGGEPRPVTSDHDRSSLSGAWTASGREIIFAGDWYEGGLFRVNAHGGRPQPLSPGGQFGYDPSISRQGHRLVYSEQTYDTDIWRLDLSPALNGKPPSLTRLISSSRRECTPNFSPDGKRIVFSSNRSGHWEIWICDSDGRNSVQLTSFGGPYITGTPRWSPDGETIGFDSRPRGKSDIFVINAETRVQRNLTVNTYTDCCRAGLETDDGFTSPLTEEVKESFKYGKCRPKAVSPSKSRKREDRGL